MAIKWIKPYSGVSLLTASGKNHINFVFILHLWFLAFCGQFSYSLADFLC